MATTRKPFKGLLVEDQPFVIRQRRPDLDDDDAFLRFCAEHEDLRIEMDEEGYLVLMAPAGFRSSERNLEIASQLLAWAKQDGTGRVTESSGLFHFLGRARRAPDATWTRKDRLASVTPQRQEKILPIPPDFLIELRSPSGRLPELLDQMDRYMEAGVRLAWLIDPFARTVHEFRPGQEAVVHQQPDKLSGDPELPGFVLDLTTIW
jgi:Uma2 family endonuclease